MLPCVRVFRCRATSTPRRKASSTRRKLASWSTLRFSPPLQWICNQWNRLQNAFVCGSLRNYCASIDTMTPKHDLKTSARILSFRKIKFVTSIDHQLQLQRWRWYPKVRVRIFENIGQTSCTSHFVNSWFWAPKLFSMSTMVMINGIVQKSALKTPQSCARDIFPKTQKNVRSTTFLPLYHNPATLRRF